MRKIVLTSIAGAALIAGSGLAAAQVESSPGRTHGAQGAAQREPGRAANERQPGAMQGWGQSTAMVKRASVPVNPAPAQDRSGAVEQTEHRSRQSGEMQGQAQGRSGASSHPGAMQGQAQGRPGAVEEKERRSGHPGAMPGQAQGRPGAVEDKERRSGQSGALQGPPPGVVRAISQCPRPRRRSASVRTSPYRTKEQAAFSPALPPS